MKIYAKFFMLIISGTAAVTLLFNATGISAGDNKKQAGSGQRNKSQLGLEVATESGKVRGTEDGNNTWVWKGIPFAKPPKGDLRWKAPVDPEPWKDVKDAVEFCEACVQYDGNMFGQQAVTGDEDCLYLNIWRPRTQERNLPVHFWIHGGGNSIGSAKMGNNGKSVAGDGNMVVVTIQYRLGPFGWFTHPDLRQGKDKSDDSGNFGTLDIIKALKWVKNNIREFGGNPDNVLIVGESAGGMNVYTMILSPLAKGLFHKGMTQSGGFWTTTMTDADADSKAVVDTLLVTGGLKEVPGGNTAAFLRGKTAKDIMSAYKPGPGGMIMAGPKGSRLGGYLDGYVLPVNGRESLSNPASYNSVPLIAGANKEETKLFIFFLFSTWDPSKSGGLSYQDYSIKASKEWIENAVDIPAKMMSSHKSQPPVFAYQLNYGAYNENGYNAWQTKDLAISLGACHALDVPLFWKEFPYFPGFAGIFREDNRAGYEGLSRVMMAYVAAFAHTGNPGSVGGVKWEQWSSSQGGAKRIIFDANANEPLIKMGNE